MSDDTSVEEAFRAGFNKTDVAITPVTTDEPKDETAETVVEKNAAETEPSEDDTPLTRAEMKAMQESFELRLKSNNDQVYGRMGGMLTKHEQRIREELKKELLASVQAMPEMSDDDVKAIKARFDDLGVGEIGDAVGDTLKQTFAKRKPEPQQQPAFDPATLDQEIDKRVQERVSPIEQRAIEAELTSLRKDWRDEIAKPGFQQWLDAQPDADEIRASRNPRVVVKALQGYDAASTQSRERDSKQTRVAAAITPTRSGNAAPATQTVEDAFRAGFYRNAKK